MSDCLLTLQPCPKPPAGMLTHPAHQPHPTAWQAHLVISSMCIPTSVSPNPTPPTAPPNLALLIPKAQADSHGCLP